MQSALPALAQSEALSPGMVTPPATVGSPLEGNWQLTGNRELKQYPLIFMAIHVNGNEVTAVGHTVEFCLTSPKTGAGGSFGISGEIAADGSFTLWTHPIPYLENVLRLTITGTVPPAGSPTWSGRYTITGEMTGTQGCSLNQGGTFSASRLPPLAGTFSGQLMSGWPHKMLKFNITTKQGELAFFERKRGLPPITYLPLTSTVAIEGSPCFQHGAAEASLDNRVEGDLVWLKFKMDDGSELSVTAFMNPEETELLVQSASAHGGKCDGQGFNGTLSRQ
jgi:hypothetical protein